MKNLPLLRLSIIILCLSLAAASCKKDRKTSWGTEMLIPIASTSLSLQNLVKDTIIKTNPGEDNYLLLNFSRNIYTFNLADQLINIPDTSIGQRFTLDSLKLPNQLIFYKASMGELAKTMLLSPDIGSQVFGQFILTQIGNTVPIPPLSGLSPGSFHFDATSFFDSAVLLSGDVEMRVYNELPIPIDGATFRVRNTADSSIITSYTLNWTIPPHDSTYIVIPLGNNRLTSQLDFEVVNLSTPGSPSVLIDTSDYFMMRILVTRMRAAEAWAKFPTQNVLDLTEDVTQEIADRKFSYVDARSGFLHIFITSSVDEQLYLEYTLVGAYDNYGRPLKVFTTVPAAPVGGTVTIDDSINIAGYAINLTGKDGTKFNTYTQRVVARIDSSGITRHITRDDSLHVRYEITEIAPNYIKGYAGRDTIHAIDSSDFSFLDIFKSGSIDLQEVNMNFTVENGIGVDGQVKINSLTAISPINGSRTLTGSIVGQPLTVGRAVDFAPPNNQLVPTISTFAINNSNSNIKDLLGILPNKLKFDAEVKTNVAGNNQQYRDFAYLESALKINLNAEMPLSLIAHSLVLKDTFSFDLSETNTKVEGISDGILNLIVQNKYPITANITMVAYDENWVAVDTVVANALVDGADLDANCKSAAPKRSKIQLYISEERMENIKRARNAVVLADFSTVSNNATCNGQYLKIYSDYKLDVTFTARFNYKINAKL